MPFLLPSVPELEKLIGEIGIDETSRVVIVPAGVSCMYIRQGIPLGLGHAVLCAQPAVGDEPFFVHLADDLIFSDVPCLKQMAELFDRTGSSVLGVETVPRDQTGSYGIVAVEEKTDGLMNVTRIVEKPSPEQAPSNLAVVGRYILTPRIFEELASTGKARHGELVGAALPCRRDAFPIAVA